VWRRGTQREAALLRGEEELPAGSRCIDEEMPGCLRSFGVFRCMLPTVAIVRQPLQMAAQVPQAVRSGVPCAGIWGMVNRSKQAITVRVQVSENGPGPAESAALVGRWPGGSGLEASGQLYRRGGARLDAIGVVHRTVRVPSMACAAVALPMVG